MTSSHSFNLFILAALTFLGCLNPNGATTCHPDDEAGLLAFKSGITKDSSGVLSSWTKGTDCCSWLGGYCANQHHVTSLSLGDVTGDFKYNLSGTISPSLSKLQHLESFDLIGLMEIRGPFPHFLLRLPNLKHIYIRSNRLSGPLPTNIGMLSPHLETLVFGGNRFTGAIPSSLSNLTRLNEFYLNDNLLTGRIPPGIGNLKLMSILRSMTKLQVLSLSHNRLSGKLCPSIASLRPSLEFLGLGQNNLSGSIPRFISRLTRLKKLDLSNNLFSGAVPNSLSKLTNIFDLSENEISGSPEHLLLKEGEMLEFWAKLHVTKFPPSVFAGNDCLCGSPLAPCKG
ncbi:hypothetical protein N665_1135s0004 [Sinapis alba]|nr:hypothetical protein N665_1135s0004 [Sinapis alba]